MSYKQQRKQEVKQLRQLEKAYFAATRKVEKAQRELGAAHVAVYSAVRDMDALFRNSKTLTVKARKR